MRLDLGGYPQGVDGAGTAARTAEEQGVDGWWATETHMDPFIAAAVAAERTSRVQLGTGIAVAFARSPMTVAVQANDLQGLSGGRFMLGLGSQIKPHITKRFSMPWSHPAARMREYVLAVRAIWDTFATDAKLDFRGDFYTHTIMAPFFNPGPNPHGNPPVFIAAVGPLMTETAGEVADGMLCHPFTTERYLREVTVPAVERGRAKAGKTLDGFQISVAPLCVVVAAAADLEAAVREVKGQIAFYASTPAYRPVLELHGWGALQDELNAMTKRGEWETLADVIDDEVLAAFAAVGTPEEVAGGLRERGEGVAARLTFNSFADPGGVASRETIALLR